MGQVSKVKVALVDLDGQTVPDGVRESLDQEGIALVVHDCKTREELSAHAGDADVVWLFGGSRILLGGNLAAVPRCRAILRTGSGTDNVPVDEATRRRIVVANTPAAVSDGVSDHLIALLFAVTRRVAELDRAVRLGRWGAAAVQPLNSVQGRTLGLVGFGHVAREVARKLSGFEMHVLAHDPYVDAAAMAAHGVTAAPLGELLTASDYVSLHCPLTPGDQALDRRAGIAADETQRDLGQHLARACDRRGGSRAGAPRRLDRCGGLGCAGKRAARPREPPAGAGQRRPDAARRRLFHRRGRRPLAAVGRDGAGPRLRAGAPLLRQPRGAAATSTLPTDGCELTAGPGEARGGCARSIV